jgi:hypothetical protein
MELPAQRGTNNPRSIPRAHHQEQKEIPKPHAKRLSGLYDGMNELVLGHFGIDLLAPRQDTAGQVLDLKTSLLQELRCFLAAAAALALRYDLAVFIQFANTLLQVA